MRNTVAVVLLVFAFVGDFGGQSPDSVDFARDIQPIFRQHCIGCHGPVQQMRGLRLDRRSAAMRVGSSGTNIAPGASEGSRLYLRLIGNQFGAQMPPGGHLTAEEINLIKVWIDHGARWPDDVSGDVSPTVPHPKVLAFVDTLRRGDRSPTFLSVEHVAEADLKGPGGATPLMYGALYRDRRAVRELLEKGADPDSRNQLGATALMWAVDDLENTRVLLEYGADPNLRSDEGFTPLLIAARWTQSAAVIKLLLEYGADPSTRSPDGLTALAGAAAAANYDGIVTLLNTNVDWKPVPVDLALRSRCDRCFQLLIAAASEQDLNNGLGIAARLGNVEAVKMLLDRGAKATSNVLRIAAGSDAGSPAAVELLLNFGADPNDVDDEGRTALDIAKRNGDTAIVKLLRHRDAREYVVADTPRGTQTHPPSVRLALERSLPLLQRADASFMKKSGCVSCHNNSLTEITMGLSLAKRDLPVDAAVATDEVHAVAEYLDRNRERAIEGSGLPGGIDTVSYTLLGIAGGGYRADTITDVWARYVRNVQMADGHWAVQAHRPPIESSDIQTTAVAMRSLQIYGGPRHDGDHDAVRRAAQWLLTAHPISTEDRVFQLLGLHWTDAPPTRIRIAGRALLAAQRSDGGWGQLSSLSSDAYATGQALFALKEARVVKVTDPTYERAIQFLLRSQFADGSWHVKSRATAIQPYFDSDFPHGRDQFISAAATNWATMALAAAVK